MTSIAARLLPGRTAIARWSLGLGLLGVVAFLVLPPLTALVAGAFTDTDPGEWPHLTLGTLAEVFGDLDHVRSLGWSLLYAAVTATLVMLLGGALAWLVARTDSRMRRATDLFTLVPILVPAVLFVTGWLLLAGPKAGLLNLWAMAVFGLTTPPLNLYSFGGMIWVGTLQELPLAFLWLWPALRAMNPDLEDAAAMAGAGWWFVLRRITLPLLRPAILSGWLLSFIYGLGALAVPLLLGLPAGRVLFATEIYLAIHRVPSDMNEASAFGLVLVAAALLGLVAYRRLTRDAGRSATVTGKAFRPRVSRLGRWRWAADLFGLVVLMLTAGLPLLVLLWNAFLPFPQPPSIAALHALTLRNFAAAWSYGAAPRAVLNSVALGLGAGLVSTGLGVLIAWFMLRRRGPSWLTGLLDQMAALPVAIPGLVVGLSLIWVYLVLPIPIYGTLWILLVAYVTLHLPYAVRICSTGLSQLHAELEEAGAVHGGRWSFVFRRILAALIAPSLATSVLYVGLRSFREYAASTMLSGPGTEVFSVMVLDMWDGGSLNVLCAYITVVTAMLGTLVWLCGWLLRRRGMVLS